MRRQGHVARTKEKENAYWVWWGKPKGKRLLRRPRSRRENKIENNFE